MQGTIDDDDSDQMISISGSWSEETTPECRAHTGYDMIDLDRPAETGPGLLLSFTHGHAWEESDLGRDGSFMPGRAQGLLISWGWRHPVRDDGHRAGLTDWLTDCIACSPLRPPPDDQYYDPCSARRPWMRHRALRTNYISPALASSRLGPTCLAHRGPGRDRWSVGSVGR